MPVNLQNDDPAQKSAHADRLLQQEINRNLHCPTRESENPLQCLFTLGQDAAFANAFTKKSTRLADVIDTLFDMIHEQIRAVITHDPLVEDSPLAREHGTRYPVIQGPMANISDNPDFARAIFDNGGLPFFAMGNLPENLARDMLEKGGEKVPRFGAGLIGIETFMSEPAPEALDTIEKFCDEYDINVALHNHDRKASPQYWHPEGIMKLCRGRSKRIGACGDLGYWMRSGIDPIEAVNILKNRLITVQMHDLNELSAGGHDVPWGAGAGVPQPLTTIILSSIRVIVAKISLFIIASYLPDEFTLS